jgi:RNA polymerase sigma factor for flagellar operon FliA
MKLVKIAPKLYHKLLDSSIWYKIYELTKIRRRIMKARIALLPDFKGARRHLVDSNLDFVKKIAHGIASKLPHTVELDDLVQDGVFGLMDAASRFDPKRGVQFTTFAQARIKGSILDGLRKQAWPRHLRKARKQIHAYREQLLGLDQEPSLENISACMGVREATLVRIIQRISMVELLGTHEGAELDSKINLPPVFIPSAPEPIEVAIERKDEKDLIHGAISKLHIREQKILWMYYFHELTMKEISEELGVNEARISQLHARAIRRLKKTLDQSPSELQALKKIGAIVASTVVSFGKPGIKDTPANYSREKLVAALGFLPTIERKVLETFYGLGLDKCARGRSDTAKALGLPESNITKIIERAKSRLAQEGIQFP